MDENTNLRRAGLVDVDGIVTLESLFPGDRMSERSVRRFVRLMTAGVWVVERFGRVIGALVMTTRGRTHRARIYSLVVDPGMRGKGLARELVKAAEAEAKARGFMGMSLEVRADNADAIAFYAKLGYGDAEPLPGYYDDGGDGVRLRRDF
jgi:ribosomal-protein-alanine N-acetyltransferase